MASQVTTTESYKKQAVLNNDIWFLVFQEVRCGAFTFAMSYGEPPTASDTLLINHIQVFNGTNLWGIRKEDAQNFYKWFRSLRLLGRSFNRIVTPFAYQIIKFEYCYSCVLQSTKIAAPCEAIEVCGGLEISL